MKTYSFIGSNKNAGKTTALNFILQKNYESQKKVIVTSIGINGESQDQFIGTKKPHIKIYKDSLFITAIEHLKSCQGLFEPLRIFTPPKTAKTYVLAKSVITFEVVLEGPNSKEEIKFIKNSLSQIQGDYAFFIDGSIDRQFLADPKISDSLYFSVLLNSQRDQLKKVQNYINGLNLPVYHFKSEQEEALVRNCPSYKTLILDENHDLIFTSQSPAFLDSELFDVIKKTTSKKVTLFLNSALTQSLWQKLNQFKNISLVIDNFTLYQIESSANPHLFVLNVTPVASYFFKEDGITKRPIKGLNLFREDLHEIRI